MGVLFDRYEESLLEQIDSFESRFKKRSQSTYSAFSSHPEGVLELAVGNEVRVAKAVHFLLNSTSCNDAGTRVKALQRLYGDVMSVSGGMRVNAARVLVEIMKALLLTRESGGKRLELARDFRETFTGKPSIVRRQLKVYQLLEMPEDGSQITFDDTVYNTNKLGKKTPSHLILDAWIKGIRRLQVIYSNYIRPEVAHEILMAARIFDIDVVLGIEFPVLYYGKFIKLVWSPIGFYTSASFLRFLASSPVKEILKHGYAIATFHEQKIFGLLQDFNKYTRKQLVNTYKITLPVLSVEGYKKFLEGDYGNEVNLSEYIYSAIIRHNVDEREGSSRLGVKEQEELIPEIILLRYLYPLIERAEVNVGQAKVMGSIAEDIKSLVKHLNNTACAYNLTLLTSNLHSWEVPEILYKAKGCIDAVEIFNLRDYTLSQAVEGKYGNARINSFRKAVNEQQIGSIKRKLSEYIIRVNEVESKYAEPIIENLEKVRRNIGKFIQRYESKHIEAAIGSGAAGRGRVFYGMGMVVEQSLPRSAKSVLSQAGEEDHFALPLGCQVYRQVRYLSGGRGVKNIWDRFIAWRQRDRVWVRQKIKEVASSLEGNIYTLSGRFGESRQYESFGRLRYYWDYLNTDIKNLIKILVGFIPAFLTFYFVSDWWVLKYGGGVIWFAITGGRNILQLLLAAGGLRSSTFFKWHNLVDRKRIAESLMFTGLSVPILEYVVKSVVLGQWLGLQAGDSPLSVYAVMSAVNGVYISAHNYFRGFPLLAVVGNLFRSVLAVPVALLLNLGLEEGLNLFAVAGVGIMVTKWSAIISKAASDLVACLIEGVADRGRYLFLRGRGVQELEAKFFAICERVELLIPQKTVLELFKKPEVLFKILVQKNSFLDEELVLWLLDLQYFWSYKPRAKDVISKSIDVFHTKDKELLLAAVKLLGQEDEVLRVIGKLDYKRQKEISAFYLKGYADFMKNFIKLFDD